MEPPNKILVEVPGFENKGFWDQWIPFSRPSLPNRKIELPIVMRLRPIPVGWVYAVTIFSIFTTIAFSVVAYGATLTENWEGCAVLGSQRTEFGAHCHKKYVPFIGFFGLLAVVSLATLIPARKKAAKRWARLKLEGPELRVDAKSFWCYQLAETIHFSNIREVEHGYYGPTRYSAERSSLTLILEKPVRLASGGELKISTWRGETPGYLFNSIGFSRDIHGAMDATAFLIEKYRSEHPR